FRPGMSASVDINTNTERNVKSIPIQSVTTREEDGKEIDRSEDKKNGSEEEINEVVFIYDADTAKMVKVETGIQDNEYIQILSGLEADQEVIIGPYSVISRKLKNGVALDRKKEGEEKDKKEEKAKEDF
ncbi:MAG: efflux RND transporter periplasmic adaptor subunit, partial [Bacteroidota bacterium]|nr:efflux RND transporter periplasmic adaptor subunit [Bacteroidota bacterium]